MATTRVQLNCQAMNESSLNVYRLYKTSLATSLNILGLHFWYRGDSSYNVPLVPTNPKMLTNSTIRLLFASFKSVFVCLVQTLQVHLNNFPLPDWVEIKCEKKLMNVCSVLMSLQLSPDRRKSQVYKVQSTLCRKICWINNY